MNCLLPREKRWLLMKKSNEIYKVKQKGCFGSLFCFTLSYQTFLVLLPIIALNREVCDATGDDSSNAAGLIKIRNNGIQKNLRKDRRL